MERKEITGALALSGKSWRCYVDSMNDEIRKINPELSDAEIRTVSDILGSMKNEMNKCDDLQRIPNSDID